MTTFKPPSLVERIRLLFVRGKWHNEVSGVDVFVKVMGGRIYLLKVRER